MDCESQLQLQQQYRITEFGRSAEFPRIPLNSAETWKFRGNGQIPRLGSKFRGPRKTVVPSHKHLSCDTNTLRPITFQLLISPSLRKGTKLSYLELIERKILKKPAPT